GKGGRNVKQKKIKDRTSHRGAPFTRLRTLYQSGVRGRGSSTIRSKRLHRGCLVRPFAAGRFV
ncbi:MAG: hypothetical protein K8R59_16610, partial [Thermoanaerobaculales bacterium]|nr:hypothetical protein [Thermoanaerobaculales bacterium]